MKVCTKCKENKELIEFNKEKRNKDGLFGSCKRCEIIRERARDRTKEGKLKQIYKNQIKTSKVRKHEPPAYTKQEFIDKYINDLDYLLLHSNWVKSSYDTILSPSFDRIDDYKPYVFDNLQLMTWQENYKKAHLDRKEGRNNKHSKAVVGTCIKTGERIEFHSMMEAKRSGFCRGGVWSCCNGERNKHKGYKWSYK